MSNPKAITAQEAPQLREGLDLLLAALSVCTSAKVERKVFRALWDAVDLLECQADRALGDGFYGNVIRLRDARRNASASAQQQAEARKYRGLAVLLQERLHAMARRDAVTK